MAKAFKVNQKIESAWGKSDIPCLTCGDSECGFSGTTVIRDDCNFSCYIPKGEDSMSDCSTEAMKPKERRTCGNCANGSRVLVSCWERDDQGEHHAPSEPACSNWLELKQYGMCSCNKSRGYDDLLQRYQQLEQVAKEMLDAIRISSSYHMSIKPNYCESFASQLEALGVSLDD